MWFLYFAAKIIAIAMFYVAVTVTSISYLFYYFDRRNRFAVAAVKFYSCEMFASVWAKIYFSAF